MSITLDLPDSLAAEIARCAERMGQKSDAFVAEAVRRLLAAERFRERRERLRRTADESARSEFFNRLLN